MTTTMLRRSITALAAAAVGLLTACSSVPATRALRVESAAGTVATPTDGPVIRMTSDDTSVTVDARDDDRIASALRTIGTSVSVDRVRGVGQLRFQGRGSNARGQLVVIDGIPVDEEFEVRVTALTVARVDVLRDSVATRPYGPRGKPGVVLVTLRPH